MNIVKDVQEFLQSKPKLDSTTITHTLLVYQSKKKDSKRWTYWYSPIETHNHTDFVEFAKLIDIHKKSNPDKSYRLIRRHENYKGQVIKEELLWERL